MTTAQINAVKDRCRYLYGASPSVTLSRVETNGNRGSISDTRKQAGAMSTSVSSLPPESTTAEPSTVTRNRAHISESRVDTTASVDTNSVAFPVYQTSGNIRSMSLTDIYDTFIYPAIDTLTSAAGQPGTYYIHTGTSLSGYTAVSSSIVYKDTRANTGAYTAGGIGETLDQPTTITNYYLLKANNISAPSMAQMLFIRNSDKNLEQYTQAEMDAWLQNCMRHAASEITGTKISYNLNGSGINLGSGMANTILNGSGNYQTLYVGLDDYRAQEFPNGSVVTVATHRLRMTQV
tara:strand:+ start:2270 stop:3145 length:876 start_codon:yes stop_codon:yes gene_type:complete